jgi:predicted amidophosphoribosyltransferase
VSIIFYLIISNNLIREKKIFTGVLLMENGLEVCSTCNAQIKPGSKFCTECGKPVEDQSHESKGKEIHDNEMAASTLNCPECNAELTAENQFCTECGAKLKGDMEGKGLGSIGEENREPITKCPNVMLPLHQELDSALNAVAMPMNMNL